MKTKFTLKAYMPLLFSLIFLIFFIIFTYSVFTSPFYDDKLFPKIFLPVFFSFATISFFYGEFRTKCITVEFINNDIIVKRFFGIKTEIYKSSDIKGFKVSHLSSNSKTYEYLYLYKNEDKTIKISQFYHKNYFEVKSEINEKIKYLGYEKLSYLDEFKEIFK